jgi:hypothetical protein
VVKDECIGTALLKLTDSDIRECADQWVPLTNPLGEAEGVLYLTVRYKHAKRKVGDGDDNGKGGKKKSKGKRRARGRRRMPTDASEEAKEGEGEVRGAGGGGENSMFDEETGQLLQTEEEAMAVRTICCCTLRTICCTHYTLHSLYTALSVP